MKKLISNYYQSSDFMTRMYIKIKLKICPLLCLEQFFPKEGQVVDLGCGNGLFPLILKLGSDKRHIIGIDLDEGKINLAKKIFLNESHMTFYKGNIIKSDYPQGNAFSLIDVLYLIPYQFHEIILKKIVSSLKPGGVLVLKEMDTKPKWKYLWNYFQETLAVKLFGFTLGE